MSFLKKLFRKKSPPPAVQKPARPKTIYEHARAIGDRFEEVAHASELLGDAKFTTAVQALKESKYTFDELVTYMCGENETVASLAICALAARNAAPAVPLLLEHINHLEGKWTKYFALEALDRLIPAPSALLGKLFVALNDDWSDGYDRFLLQTIRDFTRRRAAAGERATFDGALANTNADRLDDVHALLGKVDATFAAPMRAELQGIRDQRTNVDYLKTVGTVWGNEPRAAIIEHDQLLAAADCIVQTLTAERRRSILVVGEEGVGKTTAIHKAAERLRAKGWIIFEAGATEIGAGMTYVGELEERIQKLAKNMRGARRVAWIIPNFHELQYAGAHRYSPGGALEMIVPEIAAGAMVVIGEVSANAYQRLVERKQHLRSAFVTIRMEPLSDDETLALARKGMGLDEALLRETWQLTTQYLGRSAPGNLLGLLELTQARLRAMSDQVEIAIDDVLATLSQLTGLPLSILDDRAGLDLDDLRAHFAARVLGQPEAIDVLVERVTMIKAGVTDPTRPAGVFLFAGPTGTGKTEVAKSLAEYLFGSADRMIRIDMSELKTHDSLSRLVGDESSDATSLALEIRKQPFSVVLLDEFEKAHPNIWDLFLQVFDDGRLTDRRGVTADFRHAIIIMTSNAGAAIRTFGRAGFSGSAAVPAAEWGASRSPAAETPPVQPAGRRRSEGDVNVMKALEREFRKEFLNRIDRVVVFQPLSRETMRGILRKELSQAFRRRGLRNRDWAVEWDESALDFLLNAGFTPDLGARPLKRAVERHVLTPLAEIIVTRRAPTGDQFLFVRAEDGRLAIDFVDPDRGAEHVVTVAAGPLSEIVLTGRANANDLQREYEKLRAVIDSDEWRDRKAIALSMTSLPEFWSSPERFEILGEAELRDRIETALASVASMLGRSAPNLARRIAQKLWLIGIAIEDLRERRPSEALLAVEGTSEWTRRLAEMYREWARQRGMRLEAVEESAARVVFSVSGFGAHTLLAPEAGLHVLEVPVNGRFDRVNARVRVAAVPPGEFGDSNVVVRRYRDEPSALVRDSVRNWRTGRMDLVMSGNFDVM